MKDKKKELISKKDFRSATKVPGNAVANLLMGVFRIHKINRIYSKQIDKEGTDFIEAVLEEFEVKYQFDEKELERLPKQGGFITISNHPYGGIDGLILVKILSEARPDTKVMANFLLQRIDKLKEFFIPVNPFEKYKEASSSYNGLKEAINHIKSGHPLGIFPAGEVSTFSTAFKSVSDREWQTSAIKFIKKLNVPVVPIYFHGQNSFMFHILGAIHPALRTVKLPSEMMNKRKKIINVRIGNPIPVEEQNLYEDVDQYSRYLRSKTYALHSKDLDIKKFFVQGMKRIQHEEEIIPEIPEEKLTKEIEALPKESQIIKSKNFHIYIADAQQIPNILNEIGRLREITFRQVGEGTNRKIDIDEYDLYYYHLFVWDDEAKKIVGAYRIGKGKEILTQYGKKGFYIESLFKIKKDFLDVLNQSIELGRSFIRKEYQQKPLSLFLLWKGILYFLIKNPEYRYLIGPVSISGIYSTTSKTMIIEFIKANFYDHQLAEMITPRHKFEYDDKNVDTELLLENAANNINQLDKLIENIDPTHFKLPVLLKKYIKQNAKIIGFNIDPKFNDALDGLMILDLFEVPISTIRSLAKELNDKSILERFYGNSDPKDDAS